MNSLQKTKSFSQEGYLNENYHYFHLKDTAGQERSFHFHEFDKVVLLLSGKVDYIVENMTCSLQPWSVLLVGHHAIHKAIIDVSAPYERVILYLDRKYFERLFPSAGLMECFKTADRTSRFLLLPDSRHREELSAIITAYETSSGDSRYASATMCDTLIIQFLITLNRISSLGLGRNFKPSETEEDDKIRSVLSFINENLSQDLSIDLLAESAYLSRYHFMRLFKEKTGSTAHAYIRQKRLLYAARLIREGMPASHAALECGFHDYSVFHRAFRECFGIRPADLKNSFPDQKSSNPFE